MKNFIFALDILFIATSFVAWPLAGVYFCIPPVWTGAIAMVVTGIVVPASTWKQLTILPMPTIGIISIFALISVMNGLAIPRYSMRTAELGTSSGSFVAAVSIAMVIIAQFLGYLLPGAELRLNQIGGVFIAAFGVYVMLCL